MYKNKSIKFKITLASVILIVTSVFSVWYIYDQVDRISLPRRTLVAETNKIFKFNDIFTDMFASEAYGRIAMLSTRKSDARQYYTLMDSIHLKIDALKEEIDNENVVSKLDSIQILLDKKVSSLNEIIAFRKKYINSQTYDVAIKQIQKAKDEISQNEVSIPDTVEQKESFLKRVKNVFYSDEKEKETQEREREREELLSKKHQEQKDSIAKAAENIFTEAVQSETKIASQSYIKEAKLINENKIITSKIRDLFSEIEQNVVEKSETSIAESKATIDKTAINLAWIGGISIFLFMVLGAIVVNDLNKNYKYKRELEKLNQNMEDLVKQKTYFFASVTHDISAPLNTLFGFSNLLDNSLEDKKQKDYIKHIYNASQYIQNLVNDLVDFSKLEHNKLILKKQSFHFGDLVEQITEPLKKEAEKKNISLTTQIDEELNRYIYSDAHRILQILTNLLTNAIKFTHDGGVQLTAIKENQNIKITVSDTGIGIDKKFHSTIFNEFQQAHIGIEKVYGGTGLGLNITKRLVEMLDGSISFESVLDKGSTFTLTLPFVEGEALVNDDLKVVFDNDKKLKNKHILVIDDDRMQLKLMQEIFKEKVKRIDVLSKGNEIKTQLENHHYDLIISDIQMPAYSGYSIIRDIRGHQKYKNTPVIAFTGKTDLDENEYLKLGFTALLQKPINIKRLLNIIHKILQINEEKALHDDKLIKNITIQNSVGDFYDLTELLSFTQNDIKATNEILEAFFATTEQSLTELDQAAQNLDYEKVADTAHRMLPMFRQMKIKEVIAEMEELEKKTREYEGEILKTKVRQLRKKVHTLLEKLKNIELK